MKKNKPAKKSSSPFKEKKSSAHKSKTAGRPSAPRRKDDDSSYERRESRPAASRRKDDSSHSNFKKSDERRDKRPAARPVRPIAPPKRDDDSSFHGNFQGNGERSDKRTSRETPSGFNRPKFFDRANERFGDKQSRKTAYKKYPGEEAPAGKPSRYKETPAESEGMPLNKYISHCGICSRRKAVDFIKEGKVTVNGELIEEPAFKVTTKDVVKLSNKRISLQKNLVYILLNKPKGFITTTDDPEGRQTVMELVKEATGDRVFPVGRLDRNTSGLLLLTNDGELAQKLAHPKHNIKKIYQVGLDKPLTKADFEQIVQGVTLEDGLAQVDALGYVDSKDKAQIGIEIHSGKNRIVRRIFEHLEYKVEKLDRVMYAGLTKKNVNRGKWRFLTEKEVILLKHFK